MPEPTNSAAPNEPEKQDLHISEPREADRSWARMQPVQVVPSRERLDEAHQLVSIRNTSRDQRHIVIDRHMTGHELEPGQSKSDVDMTVNDIEYFLRQRAPNRFDSFGRAFPPHPIEIIGFRSIDKPRQSTAKVG